MPENLKDPVKPIYDDRGMLSIPDVTPLAISRILFD
jgi:hypothetical protein